jgi:AbiV family abortive infection protein
MGGNKGSTAGELSSEQREHLRVAEYRARDSARRHIDTAKTLYREKCWREACFFAMAALEEVGRTLELQHFQEKGEPHEIPQLIERLRAHHEKAVMGTVPVFIFNDDARKRHGRHPHTEIPRIDPIRYLAEAPFEWMRLKNACLYEDLPSAVTGKPTAGSVSVGGEHAYLMIIGALEALAMVLDPLFTYRSAVFRSPLDEELLKERGRRVEQEAVAFRDQEFPDADVDRLEYLANRERFEALRAAVREARRNKRSRPDREGAARQARAKA